MSVHIKSLSQSGYDHGYPVEYYCAQCKRRTFVHHPYMAKPSDGGDYFRIQFCPDYEEHNWNWTKIGPWLEISFDPEPPTVFSSLLYLSKR